MRLEVKIIGTVQGVFFRQFVLEAAQKLGLTGYVKNDPDFSVYLVAEGEEAALAGLLELVNQGPPAAEVIKTLPEFSRSTGEFKNFEIRQ